MEKYDHSKVEKKWQKRWEEAQAFRAQDASTKEKEYLLVEFPFPSGDGLHTGHVRSYTAMDAIARKRRMQGKNVLYPIGWDAFGLPTENYAIKVGKNPKIVTKENTDNFRRQLKSLGLSFDWSREINTTDPAYYKWTQWIFLQMYKKGLAYKARTTINWCPKDKIGLANEEVVDGCCERCGTPVEKREKEQWMLAITKYAQRLYDDLDTVNYIEQAKIQQRNWIGPSEGAELNFDIAGSQEKIRVFTTRPDTLFGATYMVLAPEHPLVQKLSLENSAEVEEYIAQARNKPEIERTAEGKEKTGVELKGVRAINPATKKEIPVFVADYVLGSYGTGAIMAVPAHDERDFAFAKKYNLPIQLVIEPETGEKLPNEQFRSSVVAIVEDPRTSKFLTLNWGPKYGGTLFVGGGREEGEDAVAAALREIGEETGYTNLKFIAETERTHHHYFAFSKNVARNTEVIGLHFQLVDGAQRDLDHQPDEKDKFTLEWLAAEEVLRRMEDENHLLAFKRLIEGKIYTGPGILTNSNGFDGMSSEEAKKKITETVGGEWVKTFKLRDWVFSRQRYWGEPIPMVHCDKCGWQPVPEDQLPITLPEVEKYQPTDTGESPLANIAEWVNTTCPNCSGEAKRETDVMPNWAGSSWYYLRYTDPADDTAFASKDKLKYWTPVDWYNGGMEHTTLHLLYSRFWHKFLFDIGAVPTAEPYMKRTSHGLILAEDGSKMSKSKGNTVSPDDLVERFGADSLRLYEMFIGPFDQPVAWNTSSILGVRRFLERVWNMAEKIAEAPMDAETEVLLNQTIKKVGDDVEHLKLNTAVSALMILSNHLAELKAVPKAAYLPLLQLLAPFAPHAAHELAEIAGVLRTEWETWPAFDESKLLRDTVHIAVQVNGKVRASLELNPSSSEEEALSAARANPAVAKWLAEGRETKAVYVPGRIISFVIERV